jgi:hypothetical protein
MRPILWAERSVSGPITRATNSPQAASTLMLLARGKRLARDIGDGARTRVVHALQLPSHRDIQLLDARVQRLQRTIDDLSSEERGRPENP